MPAAQGYIEETPQTHLRSLRGKVFRPQVFRQILPLLLGIVGYVDLYLNGARLIEGQTLLPPMDQLLTYNECGQR